MPESKEGAMAIVKVSAIETKIKQSFRKYGIGLGEQVTFEREELNKIIHRQESVSFIAQHTGVDHFANVDTYMCEIESIIERDCTTGLLACVMFGELENGTEPTASVSCVEDIIKTREVIAYITIDVLDVYKKGCSGPIDRVISVPEMICFKPGNGNGTQLYGFLMSFMETNMNDLPHRLPPIVVAQSVSDEENPETSMSTFEFWLRILPVWDPMKRSPYQRERDLIIKRQRQVEHSTASRKVVRDSVHAQILNGSDAWGEHIKHTASLSTIKDSPHVTIGRAPLFSEQSRGDGDEIGPQQETRRTEGSSAEGSSAEGPSSGCDPAGTNAGAIVTQEKARIEATAIGGKGGENVGGTGTKDSSRAGSADRVHLKRPIGKHLFQHIDHVSIKMHPESTEQQYEGFCIPSLFPTAFTEFLAAFYGHRLFTDIVPMASRHPSWFDVDLHTRRISTRHSHVESLRIYIEKIHEKDKEACKKVRRLKNDIESHRGIVVECESSPLLDIIVAKDEDSKKAYHQGMPVVRLDIHGSDVHVYTQDEMSQLLRSKSCMAIFDGYDSQLESVDDGVIAPSRGFMRPASSMHSTTSLGNIGAYSYRAATLNGVAEIPKTDAEVRALVERMRTVELFSEYEFSASHESWISVEWIMRAEELVDEVHNHTLTYKRDGTIRSNKAHVQDSPLIFQRTKCEEYFSEMFTTLFLVLDAKHVPIVERFAGEKNKISPVLRDSVGKHIANLAFDAYVQWCTRSMGEVPEISKPVLILLQTHEQRNPCRFQSTDTETVNAWLLSDDSDGEHERLQESLKGRDAMSYEGVRILLECHRIHYHDKVSGHAYKTRFQVNGDYFTGDQKSHAPYKFAAFTHPMDLKHPSSFFYSPQCPPRTQGRLNMQMMMNPWNRTATGEPLPPVLHKIHTYMTDLIMWGFRATPSDILESDIFREVLPMVIADDRTLAPPLRTDTKDGRGTKAKKNKGATKGDAGMKFRCPHMMIFSVYTDSCPT